jgi:hypothetical protein
MKVYRIYYNRLETFCIDIPANSKKEAKKLWEIDDLEYEEEIGDYDIKITGIEKVDDDKVVSKHDMNLLKQLLISLSKHTRNA